MRQKAGQASLIVTEDGHIVIVGKKWRSKWWTIYCTCGKRARRKDGTCKHQRAMMDEVQPEYRDRTRYAL